MSASSNLTPEEFQSSSDNSSLEHFELDIPVLLLTFKRLDETKKSFEQIRKAKPRKLYISGDGPRSDKPNEAEKVRITRDYVLNNIDWGCEVKTLLRDENLGCRKSNSSAIDWLFTFEETGIIIEDDVIVSDDFFRYAQELLYKYQDNQNIMCISANNFQNGNKYNNNSYYFSQIPHCWGWASWKSAWKKYKEVENCIPQLVDDIKNNKIPQFTHNKEANYMWAHNLIRTHTNSVDSWAYIWTIANLYFGGLTCTPSVNLAKHIGYGEDSTHIKQPVEFSLIDIEKLNFPLSHPKEIKCLQQADDFVYKRVFFVDRFKNIVESNNTQESTNKRNNSNPVSELQTRKQIFSTLTDSTTELKLLNLGCGNNFHPEWTNIDFTSTGTGVIAHNLLQGIPCNNESFDVIYHSHVLEHFSKDKAKNFIAECFRVLKPGGLIRIAVPDLEQIAKLYLEKLDKAVNGDISAEDDYDWMMLELFDQTVRNQSGGDMQKYLGNDKLKNMDFIRDRIGLYADSIRNSCLNSKMNTQSIQESTTACTPEDYMKIGAFRMGGEIHQWMYDRFSVARLLNNAGFEHIGIVSAYESSFEDFSRYNLDIKNGKIVKADSLFVEAIKPGLGAEHTNNSNTANESKSNSTIFLNNGGIKVLTLSSKDSGGAGGAARRMHEALLKAGADAVMVVLDKATTSERVAKLEIPIPNLDPKQPSAQLFYAFNLIQKRLANYPKRQIPSMFTSTESIINYTELEPFFAQADIIHIHWIDGFFDYQHAPKALQNKKIIWTLHDMYQFTGGCHYALDCKNYISGCQSCPQLGEDASCSLTQESIQIKNTAYSQLDINIVTPSKWLSDCAKQSLLMKKFPCNIIPNTFDFNTFKPINMNEARTKYDISKKKCIILFGADHILNPVKNLIAIINCLVSLCNENLINPDNFALVVFGAGQLPNETYPFSIQQLGTIASAEEMAYVYSSADFLVLPSIADNYPNIMCEALACGTPVVGFDIGGLPDLITSGKTGYLAKPFDLKQLQQGILWGINTAKGNKEIRLKCREIIENTLTEKIISNKMLSYYKEVLNKSQNTTNNNNLYNITSNDTLRKRYITKIQTTQESELTKVASKFSNEIINWLVNNLSPHKNLTDEETVLKQECIKSLNSQSSSDEEYLKALLLSVVLTPAEELPLTIDIYKQPDIIKNLLTQYIFSFKKLPAYNNFAEITLEHMITYLQMLKTECDKNPGNASNLILNAFNTLRKIPIYCAQGGLHEVMKLFADLMRKLLILNNATIDFDFKKRNNKRKIRLGILLQAFGEHTETYATLPTFTHLDKDEYEIFAFVLRISNSSQEQQYRDHYNHIIEISPSEIAQSVAKIREADLDILLIGTNITALANHNALITSHRLARVQAVHFCNPCTTGIKNIDYFITGKNFALNQNDFTEKLIFTKHSGICFEGNTIVKPATLKLTRNNLGIPDNSIAFIAGANFYKLTWELREFWAKLLKQIPNSCLLLFPFGPAWTDKYPVNEFKESIYTQFTDLGVEPSRLIISKALPAREDIRKAVSLCDIYLDSFPYSGATSLLDPLYTNIPIVCMKTNTIRGGQGSGMLEDMELTELIAKNENEYSAIASKLAHDTEYRQYISTIIKEKMDNNPPFIDTYDYCNDMDRIYKQMLAEYDESTEISDNINMQNNNNQTETINNKLKPNDPCSCGSGLKFKKCCGKKI